MGIWENGEDDSCANAGSGGERSSFKNNGIKGGFIVERYGLVGSFIARVVVHIVVFLF